jgi:hypothetical protein
MITGASPVFTPAAVNSLINAGSRGKPSWAK